MADCPSVAGARPDNLALAVAIDHPRLGTLALDAPAGDSVAGTQGERAAENDRAVAVPLALLSRPQRVVDRVRIVEDRHGPEPLLWFEGQVWLVFRDRCDLLAG